MQATYDVKGARKALSDLSEIRNTAEGAKMSVQQLTLSNHLQTCKSNDNRGWVLVAAEEELVFMIQGIITGADLPPFKNGPARYTQPTLLRQTVVLSGLGEPIFEKALNGVRIADEILQRNVPQDSAASMTCIDRNADGETLTLSNRYFVHRRFASEPQVLSDEIDPNRVLRNLAGTEYQYTSENVVEYWQSQDLGKETQSFSITSPATYRIGDIVEVQFTLATMPIGKGGKPLFKTFPTLRSITLLDSSFTRKAALAQQPVTQVPRNVLKRKIGNWGEIEVDTARRMKKMNVQE